MPWGTPTLLQATLQPLLDMALIRPSEGAYHILETNQKQTQTLIYSTEILLFIHVYIYNTYLSFKNIKLDHSNCLPPLPGFTVVNESLTTLSRGKVLR